MSLVHVAAHSEFCQPKAVDKFNIFSKIVLWFVLIICFLNYKRYYTREDSENAIRYINGTRLDDRIVRTDWDAGFKEGRQYGRGKSGGQVCYK